MHHILLDNGLTHLQATVVLCGLSLANTILFFLLHRNISNTESLLILAALFGLYMLVSFLLKMRIMYVSTHPRRRRAVLRRELQGGLSGRRLVDYL
jgi:hypothetical protein